MQTYLYIDICNPYSLLFLVAWHMLRQRAFYEVLQQGGIVDFQSADLLRRKAVMRVLGNIYIYIYMRVFF